jgi:Domain of unknown function (DUF4397)
MSCWSKAAPLRFALTLCLAALCIVCVSCGSNGTAQIRMVNAIPDSPTIDVYINGIKIITGLPFRSFQPATDPATYVGVTGGSSTIEGFPTGSTVNPISPNGTITLGNDTQYTVVAIGLSLSDSPPLVLVDNNTIPTSGNVEFRIVNASPSSPATGLDIYIVPPGTDITDFTPQISGLNSGQGSDYQSLTFLSGGYSVIATAHGQKAALINQPYITQSASITTLVIVDNQGSMNGMSTTPMVLTDLN